MTPSRAASLIYATFAVLVMGAGWLAVFRNARVEELRERLEGLRDAAFDELWKLSGGAASGRATEAGVAWIGTLACHADMLTAGRFLLVWLAVGWRGLPASSDAAEADDAYTAEAASIVRRHLLWGCLPLALIPRDLLKNQGLLRLIIRSRLG